MTEASPPRSSPAAGGEESRLERESRLELLLDSTAEGIYGIDLDGRIDYVNAAAVRLLGAEGPADLTGRVAHDLIHHTAADGAARTPDDCPIYHAFREGREIHVSEDLFWRLDGSSFPVEYRSYPLRGEGAVVGAVVSFLDISERKWADEALRQAEQRKLSIMQNAIDAFYITTPEGVSLEVNLAAAEMEMRPAEEIIGRPILSIIPPEDRAGVEMAFRLVLEHGRIHGFECRAVRGDGSLVFVEVSATRVIVGGETVIHAIVRDVSGRVAMGSRLKKLARAVEQAQNVVFLTDVEGVITFVNPAFEAVYGYSSAEAIGQTPRILKSGLRDDAFYRDFWRDMLADGFHGEVVNRCKDGSLVTVSASARCVRDDAGDPVGFVAVQTDVTAQKRIAGDLAVSEDRLRVLMENAEDGIIVCTPDGVLVDANRSIGELVGRGREEVLGRNVLEFVPEADRPAAEKLLAAVCAGESFRGAPMRVAARDGRIVPVELSAARVQLGDQFLLHGIVRDVTDRQSLEAQLRQAQKMEAIGQLAGGIAHDFNNILMVIQGISDVVPLHAADGAALARDVDNIRLTTERAAGLIRQLLEFSRRQVVKPEVLDAAEVVSSVAAMLESLVGKGISLTVDAPAEAGRVRLARAQLEQVLVNLAVNARDAMPAGGNLGISVRREECSEAPPRADGGRGDCVVFRVSDTGTGIPENIRPRIFEPFFTTKEIGRGTGLGLATVYGIVKEAGGEVAVESEPGVGTLWPRFEVSPAATSAW